VKINRKLLIAMGTSTYSTSRSQTGSDRVIMAEDHPALLRLIGADQP
jgi:hypothetical protein